MLLYTRKIQKIDSLKHPNSSTDVCRKRAILSPNNIVQLTLALYVADDEKSDVEVTESPIGTNARQEQSTGHPGGFPGTPVFQCWPFRPQHVAVFSRSLTTLTTGQ